MKLRSKRAAATGRNVVQDLETTAELLQATSVAAKRAATRKKVAQDSERPCKLLQTTPQSIMSPMPSTSKKITPQLLMSSMENTSEKIPRPFIAPNATPNTKDPLPHLCSSDDEVSFHPSFCTPKNPKIMVSSPTASSSENEISFFTTPKTDKAMNGKNARSFSSRASLAGTTGSVQKSRVDAKADKRVATGSTLINSTAKKVRLVVNETISNPTQRSNIPKAVKKGKMPDFAKLHAQEFNKMDTVVAYLQKKKKRPYALTPGPKSAKMPSDSSATNIKALKPIPLSPLEVSAKKSAMRHSPRNSTPMPKSSCQQRKVQPAFALKNVSVNEANFNFGAQATRVNDKSAKSNSPFRFTAKASEKRQDKALSNITNSSINNSRARNTFNLEASLSKPLSYTPHKGKLPEWNPKKKLEERKAMASKVRGKTKRGDIIKGVRLNKKTEHLMKVRGVEFEG